MKKYIIVFLLLAGILRAGDIHSSAEYLIEAEFADDKNELSCVTRISAVNSSKKDLEEIYLYFHPFHIREKNKMQIDIKIGAVTVNGRKAPFKEKDTYIIISAGFGKKAKAEIAVSFRASVPRQQEDEATLENIIIEQLLSFGNTERMKQSDYGIFSRQDDIISLGYFCPFILRMNDDGFILNKKTGFGDIFTFDTASISLALTVPDYLTPVFNGKLISEETAGVKKRKYIFLSSKSREASLVLYKKPNILKSEKTGIPVTIYSSAKNDINEKILLIAENALTVYGKLFGKYPFDELKIAEMPLLAGAGGIEFSGMIGLASLLYKTDIFKSDTEFARIFSKMMDDTLEFAIAHEVAHEWWYAGMGFDSSETPYIDEGLASFSAALYYRDAYSPEASGKIIRTQVSSGYKLMRILEYPDMPLKTRLEDFRDPLHFMGIIYGKAPMFFWRLYEKNPGLFLENLRALYNSGRFSVMPDKIFLERLKKGIEGADAFYDRWLNDKKADEDIGVEDFLSFYRELGFDLADEAKMTLFMGELMRIPAFRKAFNEAEKELFRKY